MVKERENIASFRFSEESKTVLQDLFSRYPPDDVDMTENKVGVSSGKTDNVRVRKDALFCRPAMNQSDIVNKVESLASRIETTPNLRQVRTPSWYSYYLYHV